MATCNLARRSCNRTACVVWSGFQRVSLALHSQKQRNYTHCHQKVNPASCNLFKRLQTSKFCLISIEECLLSTLCLYIFCEFVNSTRGIGFRIHVLDLKLKVLFVLNSNRIQARNPAENCTKASTCFWCRRELSSATSVKQGIILKPCESSFQKNVSF